MLWTLVSIKFSLQLFFVLVIFLSDALDGMISRRICLPLEQYRFRILDTIIDKIGILVFLTTLLLQDRISITLLLVIVGYNILLEIFPIIYILQRKKERKIDWIQATIFSRFYAISIGLYCFWSMSYRVKLKYEREWIIYFLILGLVSLISHICFFKIRENIEKISRERYEKGITICTHKEEELTELRNRYVNIKKSKREKTDESVNKEDILNSKEQDYVKSALQRWMDMSTNVKRIGAGYTIGLIVISLFMWNSPNLRLQLWRFFVPYATIFLFLHFFIRYYLKSCV